MGGNSNVPLPPGAEVFKVTVGIYNGYLGTDNYSYGSIQPSTFKGLEVGLLANASSGNYGVTIILGEFKSVGQSVTSIRLDSGLEVTADILDAGYGLYYLSTQKLFTDEGVNKTIEIALIAN